MIVEAKRFEFDLHLDGGATARLRLRVFIRDGRVELLRSMRLLRPTINLETLELTDWEDIPTIDVGKLEEAEVSLISAAKAGPYSGT